MERQADDAKLVADFLTAKTANYAIAPHVDPGAWKTRGESVATIFACAYPDKLSRFRAQASRPN